MQFMRQIHRISSPTMVSSWSGTAIGKILFFLTITVCILSEAQSSTAAAENESEKLIFSGRAVDNNGVPVANAELRYAIRSYPLEGNADFVYSTSSDPEYVTRTGVGGTFRFEFPPSELRWARLDSKKMLKRLHIAVTHPDHAISWQEFPLQSAADVEIQLETPGVISGKVMNEAGEPIQNAEVQIQHFSGGALMQEGIVGGLMHDALPPPVKTDANGEFVLRGLPQGMATNLEIQGPEYAQENRHRVPVGTVGLEFRLKPAGTVKGRLSYAETGAPVKEARVVLQGFHPTDEWEYWEYADVDASGNYLLTNLAYGTYSLYLSYGPTRGWTAIPKESIIVPEGQAVSNVDLILIRSGFITGRVTDRDTNEPIANHSVRLNDAARPEESQLMDHHTQTDTTGVYRFDAAPGRALVHTNTPAGYQDIGQTGRFDIGQIQRRVDVVEGETVVVDFQFSKGTKLVGRLLTETGEPVSGALITDSRDRHKEYGRSDELGVFTVGGLRSGQKLSLKAEHSGLGLRGTVEIEVQPDASVEIRMERYGQIKVSGRVIDHTGKPMPSVSIHLTRWGSDGGGYGTDVAVTDSDGRFQEIRLVVGDRYTISVEAEGYREATTEQFTAAAEMTEIADLVLLSAGGQFFIEGRVTDTSGEPVRGVQLGISQGGQHWSRRTDENGNYLFEDLSMAVVFTLHVYDPRYARHEFKSLRTNQWHDLVLIKADGYLAGKVVDADGKPIERVRVMIKAKEDPSSGYRYFPTNTDVHGEFELRHIKDSVVSLHVSDRKHRKIFENIAVNQRDLVFALTPADGRPELTPEQQAERSYSEACRERFKTLVSQLAPELTVAEWVSGPPISIEDLKGKTIALHFWTLDHIHHAQQIRLLNILQEVYREKGLVCVAICPSTSAVEKLKQHIAAESLPYSIGLDRSIDVVGAEGETFDRYAMSWGGEIVLINPAGEIAGRAWENEYEDKIQALLAD